MDDLAIRLNHRKEQVIILNEDNMLLDDKMIYTSPPKVYPFAMVLRLRVLQIVCGITGLVMGMVATIEEKGKMNLGLAIPAGILTVIAAAGSIYMSHGFSGYRPQQLCDPRLQPFRFLGPTIRSAVALTVLWLAACLLHACLLYFSARSLFRNGQIAVLATILILLTLLTLLSTAALVHIDCKYDPD
ncbi:uncharacterized protein LOC114126533 [Aphis gossypii]|uniref:Uncharacterized protein n=1 Tax=Aphis gossypii TaxID=80765 RepID=A0A9P0JJE3_APHGO|nr:uncharacterized protein LOC114126533 [Aphis gossypii]CAH1739026.1 unnamed protein product [Aphis gossypii]